MAISSLVIGSLGIGCLVIDIHWYVTNCNAKRTPIVRYYMLVHKTFHIKDLFFDCTFMCLLLLTWLRNAGIVVSCSGIEQKL